MNNFIFPAKNRIVSVFVVFMFLLASCAKDDNNTAADGRDKYEGSWKTSEKSKSSGQTTFTISITKSNSDAENILIKNFNNLSAQTTTIVKTNGNNLSINAQNVTGFTVSGTGFFSNNQINWTYYVDDGNETDTCTAVSTK